MYSVTGEMARQFKALADPQRLRLLALFRQGECHVTELTQVLGQSQPRVSQQLKLLCEAGLLERFRDGQRVFYRLQSRIGPLERRLLGLLPERDPVFDADLERLRVLRGTGIAGLRDDAEPDEPDLRALHRAILDFTVAAPVGDLLDIGCGRGRILKLLASRANRAIGVDVDAEARRLARAELLLAGLPNCSLRHGDMYALPFADESFDTIVLDDVLAEADSPVRALVEARRLLKPGGRLFVLIATGDGDADRIGSRLAEWGSAAELRLAAPRRIPKLRPAWLLSLATRADAGSVAA